MDLEIEFHAGRRWIGTPTTLIWRQYQTHVRSFHRRITTLGDTVDGFESMFRTVQIKSKPY
jgi:hypothetical protein